MTVHLSEFSGSQLYYVKQKIGDRSRRSPDKVIFIPICAVVGETLFAFKYTLLVNEN